ncbi:MAG: hypothetical protein M0D55_17260 [Elusimicrobiota bacterium]|nr:MAG: hypothetical protein M0D55_17260 [Elusimicrobiota bacterium]
MSRLLVGALICGLVLSPFSDRSTPACLLAGLFAALLVLQLGARSVVEKTGAVLTAAAIAWLAGPRAPAGQSLFFHLFGWALAGTALSVYLHPRGE